MFCQYKTAPKTIQFLRTTPVALIIFPKSYLSTIPSKNPRIHPRNHFCADNRTSAQINFGTSH